jgi:RimJ/RimL family protein N-acetyltransferase
MPAMKPILHDFPEEFETERLTIRAPRFGDGLEMYEAVRESIDNLRPWMPWAQSLPTPDEYEELMREQRLDFLGRENMMLLLFLKRTHTLAGSSGLHRINWEVPKFEIGYWVRRKFEGQGYIIEAVEGITRFAFGVLGARRVEIRVDDRNLRSWRIPERLGFELEGIIKNDTRDVAGKLRNTRVYAQVKGDNSAE